MRRRVGFALLTRASIVLVGFAAGTVVAAMAGSALIVYVPYAAVGAILVVRRPRNAIGWLLAAIGWVFALGWLPVNATAGELETLTASPIALALAWFKLWWSFPLTLTFLAVLAIAFPTGRLPSGRWRGPAVLLLGTMAAVTLLAAVWPVLEVNPDGIAEPVRMPNPLRLLPADLLGTSTYSLGPAVRLAMFALLIASIASMLRRYQRSSGMERLQLRWLVAGLGSIVVAVPVGFLLFTLFGSAIEGFAWLPAIVAFALPPIAIGIAVTRYRLYEIDRLISRTIGWAIVTGVLVVVFGGLVVGLQAILAGFTQGQTLAVAASTLAAFALFQPLRRRIQTTVDRRFNRSRYDAQRTVEGFAAGLRNEFDLDRVGGRLGTVVGLALAPTSVVVWLRPSLRTPDR